MNWSLGGRFGILAPVQRFATTLVLFLVGLLALTSLGRAEEHRATRLGHPATRFAPTMHTVDDLRARFRDEKLWPDFGVVLQQWGWSGDLQDLRRAGLTAEVIEGKIPVGTRMPFMSSRKNGAAICLRNVIWAGEAPVEAYAFNFSSKGRLYRCVIPKPCSNFFLEDLGPAPIPMPALALQCNAPDRQFTGRPIKVTVALKNTGDGAESRTSIALPIPPGASFVSATEGGEAILDRVTWEVAGLATNSLREFTAVFTTERPGRMEFRPVAIGTLAGQANCECHTQVLGVYAVLVEVIDLEDPVEIGKPVNYVITVTNQGNQTGTGIRVVCTVPDSQEFVSGSGSTPVQAIGRTIKMSPLPSLDGKQVATWRVQTRALRPDDSRFKVEFATDQFEKPIRREESTRLF
ncbi:MAG: DUF11 domain-containing protein [Verrucomicrobia bacterium]|nr:DUF11 domain-containing protein [Verrucomicrobiota bacterium]NDD40605.1 DUF11 domain-containing protein [Verrucomicrobiota bacterium]NDF00999.1 DUF11 domain-containing protein [Verrucomicrobiota bacterium]